MIEACSASLVYHDHGREVFAVQAIDLEVRMLCQSHPQKQITCISAAAAAFAPAGQPELLSLGDAGRNLDLIGFRFHRAPRRYSRGPRAS